AFTSFFPTVDGESVMLDLGANIECDADNLVQFAVMGTAFSRAVLGVERPRVALLNVGSEELKGHGALKIAAERLRAADSPAMEFIGYVEGNDIPAGTADVVVTDGFTGNVALKTAEGTAKLIITFLRGAFRRSLMSRLGYLLARGAIAALRDRIDPRIYNGAMFVGLNGVVVKSHGGADAMGFASAIGVAHDMVIGGISDKIIEELRRMDSSVPDVLDQAAVS
ncbi:MAG: phosphate acyltransferase, partial [Proteobacteria bacterium]|nr:phosphate acyltransferase [Pseudomonadota bacterium]